MELIDLGASRSFPDLSTLRDASAAWRGTMILGGDPVARARALAGRDLSSEAAIAVELHTECLGLYLGEQEDTVVNVVGFSRYRLGRAAATDLVEVVRTRATSQSVIAAIHALFNGMGLSTAVCADAPGRIVDYLLRPYLNAALASVDEGLAPPEEMDMALRLGLGHPLGPIELLHATGMEEHYRVSSELYEALGSLRFNPARRARARAWRTAIGLD
ncbi:3-hydroxyacyl-CoA dehydrogenase family protein [Verticiella sediminum]|nr:3-hydroxyacyl-CoA dehydrogenase family protein [Verticiella sediminum]